MIRTLLIIGLMVCMAPAIAQDEHANGDVPIDPMDGDIGRLEATPPIYPAGYWQVGITATCTAIFSVNERGNTYGICVDCETNAPGHPARVRRIAREFSASARRSLRGWRYEQGNPREGVETTIEFRVSGFEGVVDPEAPPTPQCRRYQNQ
jgi:hypothetical protein